MVARAPPNRRRLHPRGDDEDDEDSADALDSADEGSLDHANASGQPDLGLERLRTVRSRDGVPRRGLRMKPREWLF